MKVIEFLKEHGTKALTEQYSVIVKESYTEDGKLLYVLNYNQIDSPKLEPITMECRGLILDKDFNVVSRSFDRFFNHGEAPELTEFDIQNAVISDKVDGSLIKVYNYDGIWYISTRGTAFAESNCNGFDTFYKLVLKALPFSDIHYDNRDEQLQTECNFWLDSDWTYIFEFTSVENRVVTRYDGYQLHYLAARHNETGEYGDEYEENAAVNVFDCNIPTKHTFDSVEHCVEVCKHLKDLKEGYVVYVAGKPVCKIKSPAYVAVHHIRSAIGLTPNSISKVVVLNEYSEYLTYFPEDDKFFTDYIKAWENIPLIISSEYEIVKNINDQKEFALSIMSSKYKSVMFNARKYSLSITDVISNMSIDFKIKLLIGYVDGN